jgi:hypothetical protein
MPSIREIFKKKPHGDADTVRSLQNKVAELTLTLNDTEHDARQAYLAAEADTSLKSAANEASNDVKLLQEQLHRANGALAEAEELVEENQMIAEDADAEAAWRKVEKLVRARQDLGVEIDTLILNLADKYKEMLTLGDELYYTAPTRAAKLHNSLLAPDNIAKSLRLYLHKKGFKWAAQYPWNPDDIKPFSDAVKDGNTAIMAHRPDQEDAA